MHGLHGYKKDLLVSNYVWYVNMWVGDRFKF